MTESSNSPRNVILQELNKFCYDKCNNICKFREKETKENCIIKKFIDQL